MSNLEGNAYTAPQADLRLEGNNNNLNKLPRISAWLVFLFSILTLGIYVIYWLYSRVRVVNELQNKPIAIELLYGLIGVLVATVVVAFMEITMLDSALNIVYYVIFFVIAYSLRNRLHDIFAANNHEAKIGPILTFFFNIIYLQYKINEAIDAKS